MQEVAVTTLGDAPRWTLRFVGNGETEREFLEHGATVSLIEGPRATLVSVRVPQAVLLDASDFQEATVGAYETVRRMLTGRPGLNPVRMWNFIPEILAPLDPFPQRYMAFNAGRHRAFQDWQAGSTHLSAWVPTSSGVGNLGPDLVVRALASEDPGIPIENPRQVPSYRYSPRYGSPPPCFARGVRLSSKEPGSEVLMIGGTASVVGERTRHARSLRAQIEETLVNVVSLIQAGLPETAAASECIDTLTYMRQLVVYYTRAEDRHSIENMMKNRLGNAREIEFVHTTLCRPDLLIEIEGIASAGPTPALI